MVLIENIKSAYWLFAWALSESSSKWRNIFMGTGKVTSTTDICI